MPAMLTLLLVISQPSQDEVVASHDDSVRMIRTLSCRVTLTYTNIPFSDESAIVFWNPNSLRIKQISGNVKNDIYIANGIQKNQAITPKGIADFPRTIGNITNRDAPIPCNPWTYALLTVAGTKNFRVSLKELISDPEAKVTSSKWENGFHILQVDQPRKKLVVTLDPKKNFLISSLQSGPVLNRVVEFVEPAPGIFFPKSVLSTGKDKEGRETKWIASFTDIKINQKIPDDAFDFKFLPGITVVNSMTSEVKKADERGDPVLPAKSSTGSIMKAGQPDQLEPRSNPGDVLPKTQTASQSDASLPLNRWILAASIFGLMLGLLFIIRGRK